MERIADVYAPSQTMLSRYRNAELIKGGAASGGEGRAHALMHMMHDAATAYLKDVLHSGGPVTFTVSVGADEIEILSIKRTVPRP